MTRTLRLCAAAAVMAVGSLAPLAAATAAEAAGRIVDFALEPPPAPLRVGDSITWTNAGQRPHTVTDRGGFFNTGPILPGATGKTTFDIPGTYDLFCEINPGRMNATVVVEPGSEAVTRFRVEALDELRDGETKRFEPAQLDVPAGSRIIMANIGGLRHSLVAEGGEFEVPVVEPGPENGRFAGGNASVVVEEPGTYVFFCEIHPAAMRGRLVVADEEVDAGAAPEREEADAPPRAEVDIRDFAFDETDVVVVRAGRVTWTNRGAAPHTATFDDVSLDTGRLEPGAEASLTAPEQPGTYSYYCKIHPARMRGVLSVRAAAAAAGDQRAAPAGDDRADRADGDDGDDVAGTVFAYLVAAGLFGVGGAGLALGLRRPASG